MNNVQSPILLTEYTYIDLVGDDCDKFLQGQLTIDVASIESQQAKLAAICNPKGRIVSLFYVHRIDNGVRFLMPAEISQDTATYLNKYLVFYKTKIQEKNSEIKIIAIKPSIASSVAITNTDYSVQYLSDDPLDVSQDISIWYKHLAERKIPWLTSRTVEQFLPHNLDLPAIGAINFNKGCFTGQEVIARMQYKGKLKQHLHQLSSSDSVEFDSGQAIYRDGKKTGEIICGINIVGSGCLMLALIKDSELEHKNFQLESENSPILELI